MSLQHLEASSSLKLKPPASWSAFPTGILNALVGLGASRATVAFGIYGALARVVCNLALEAWMQADHMSCQWAVYTSWYDMTRCFVFHFISIWLGSVGWCFCLCNIWSVIYQKVPEEIGECRVIRQLCPEDFTRTKRCGGPMTMLGLKQLTLGHPFKI